MDFHPNLPEYSDYMYLQGYQPHEIMEAFRRTTKKKLDKKREESISWISRHQVLPRKQKAV